MSAREHTSKAIKHSFFRTMPTPNLTTRDANKYPSPIDDPAINPFAEPGLNPPHTSYRPITAAECHDLARRSWMPAAASEAFVRAARTIEALEDNARLLARLA